MKRRARGDTWQALLDGVGFDPRNGWHLSVSGPLRLPTDDEVTEAKRHFPEVMEELVEARHAAAINPYVRHFVSERAVEAFPQVYQRVT